MRSDMLVSDSPWSPNKLLMLARIVESRRDGVKWAGEGREKRTYDGGGGLAAPEAEAEAEVADLEDGAGAEGDVGYRMLNSR